MRIFISGVGARRMLFSKQSAPCSSLTTWMLMRLSIRSRYSSGSSQNSAATGFVGLASRVAVSVMVLPFVVVERLDGRNGPPAVVVQS